MKTNLRGFRLLFMLIIFPQVTFAGTENCPANVTTEQVLTVNVRSIENFGPFVRIEGCDAKELYEGYAGFTEVSNHPQAYCNSFGECSRVKVVDKNGFRLECRMTTLILQAGEPNTYDCAVSDSADIRRIKDFESFEKALHGLSIRLMN